MANATISLPTKNGKHGTIVFKGKVIPGKSADVHPALNLKDGHCVLSPEELQLCEVWRYKDDKKKGFQRNISPSRVKQIASELQGKSSSDHQEILIANLDGKGIYLCIDGQHRREGHISAGVPCPAEIRTMSLKEARRLFLRNNGKARGLKGSELVNASAGAGAMFLKALAESHVVPMTYLRQLMIGLTSNKTYNDVILNEKEFDTKVEEMAGIILDSWLADTRWAIEPTRQMHRDGKLISEKTAYSSAATMYVLGRLAREYIADRDWKSQTKFMVNTIKSGPLNKTTARSFRALQGSGPIERKALLTYLQTDILLPAMRSKAKGK